MVAEAAQIFRRHGAPGAATRIVTVLALVAAFAIVPTSADARPITPSTKNLVAGSAVVASCGTLTGVVPNFTISGTTVTAVVLTNIPATCNGGRVSVTVTSAGTSLGQGGPVTVASGAATVPISPAAAIASVTHVRLAVVGP